MSDVLIDEFIESVVYIGGDADWHKSKLEDKSWSEEGKHPRDDDGKFAPSDHGVRMYVPPTGEPRGHTADNVAVYHGTVESTIESILSKGITPHPANYDPGGESAGPLVHAARKKSVYVTTSLEEALHYASGRVDRRGGAPDRFVVFEAEVPDNQLITDEVAQITSEPDDPPTGNPDAPTEAYRVEGVIAPASIRGYKIYDGKTRKVLSEKVLKSGTKIVYIPVVILPDLEGKSLTAADVLALELMSADEWLTEKTLTVDVPPTPDEDPAEDNEVTKALTEALWEINDWLLDRKSGTSEGAKLGWEHREHGGTSGSENEDRAAHMEAAVKTLELSNAYRKAADRLVSAKLALGTGQYKTPDEYAARKKELKDAMEQEAELSLKHKDARRALMSMPLYGKSGLGWSEAKHPRDESGKFGEKGGGAVPAGSVAPAEEDLGARVAHIEVRTKELLQQGQDTLSLHDKVNGMMGAYTPERQRQHKQIIDDIMQANEHVKSEHRAVISGGLGGAGKSTTLRSDIGKSTAGINPDEFLTINPDDMKNELIKRNMLPDYDGVNPGEAAGLMHEESSKLAWDLHYRAVAAGKNVIWDMSMNTASGVEQRLNKLNEAGYKVKLVYVHTTVETSIKRSDARYQNGLNKDPKTARFVPHAVIENQRDPEYGTKNKKAFEAVKNRANDGWFLFDNNGDSPKLISRSE